MDLTLRPNPSAVRETLRQLRAQIDTKIAKDKLDAVELISAEVLNNVVQHAFAPPLPEFPSIDFSATVAADRLFLVVVDNGHPLPENRPPRSGLPGVEGLAVQDLPEGGFGWGLIHRLSLDVQYKRINGQNRLRITVGI